jgi:hypothetical protein
MFNLINSLQHFKNYILYVFCGVTLQIARFPISIPLLKWGSSVTHNLVYSLIIIKLATCFDPVGLSDLHYEPFNVRKLLTSLGSQ